VKRLCAIGSKKQVRLLSLNRASPYKMLMPPMSKLDEFRQLYFNQNTIRMDGDFY